MGRAPCCDKANVKRGPWSPEEDAVLKSYLEKHGTGGNWIALPLKAGLKRCGKSCRLRWLNYLRPDIKHGGFTEEEDNIILALYNNIGSRWSVIASHLPGRTDNDVKNYWNTKLKKKLMVPCSSNSSSIAPPTQPPLLSSSTSSISYIKEETGLQNYSDFHHHDQLFMPPGFGFVPSEFMQFPAPVEGYSPADASSSSVTMENSSSSSSGYFKWSSSGGVGSVDDVLLSELGFGSSFSEFLGGYGYSEIKMEENMGAPCHSPFLDTSLSYS
ncbi:hypothetical protein J5N97_004816 [Dioscorea zingiberensis]|uniref:Uncharacterized protein n=1 Tax=Dioscorea zingiberensis TaxID=325984 RepID=A0A9D5HRB2_9LILI|nr:hypothetical protein J5N97_004816 [Dioscorea zingiberensis]